jgi:hypothetical protein
MAWSHRYIGNPVLTKVLNVLFDLDVTDAHSGLRAFTRPALDSMGLSCEGMECASEIVVKAARVGLRVAEVPIVYRPRIGESKLKALRDGWRHLRFLLTLSPTLLFFVPGALLMVAGVLGTVGLAFAGGGSSVLWARIGCALVAIFGNGLFTGGLFAGTYSRRFGFEDSVGVSKWIDRVFSLERGLAMGGGLLAIGLLLAAFRTAVGWGPIFTDATSSTCATLALLCGVLGVQIGVSSFVLNIFQVIPQSSMIGSRLPSGATPLQ